jgi:hypothetical protein
LRGPIWRADVARLLGMLEVGSSAVMRVGEEQKIAGPRKRCNPAFIPRTVAWDFMERAYLMAWAGLLSASRWAWRWAPARGPSDKWPTGTERPNR